MKDRRGGRRSSQGNINREEEIGEWKGIGRVKAEIGKIERWKAIRFNVGVRNRSTPKKKKGQK